jgi:riboflavin kinase/FMN adenylyltransferase
MSPTVVSIGNFDGVHRGHATLIRRARALAGDGARVVALAFDPHPSRVLRPGSEPARLTTFEQRSALLRAAGADEVRRLEPDRTLLSLSPEAFLRHVVEEFEPGWLVEGADFHFGRGRSGHAGELREIGRVLGFAVEIVEPVEVVLSDHSVVTASSSLARWLLRHGRVPDAAAVLGRAHEVVGRVVPGDRRGRTIGFPTANLESEQYVPGAGVYAGRATLPDGRVLPAAVHVGERPTIGDGRLRLEAHLLGLPTSPGRGAWAPIQGLPESGWVCRLSFEHRLRDAIRFGSIDSLAGQLNRDCARAGELLSLGATPEFRCEEVRA